MTRERHQSRRRPGIVMAMLVAMLLVGAPFGSGVPALAEEAPVATPDHTFWNEAAGGEAAGDDSARDEGAWDEGAWEEGAWEQRAGPTLAGLAREDAPSDQPPVVELRLRPAPVGLAVEVADGVHLGAAGDYDHRTREAVALFALRLSL